MSLSNIIESMHGIAAPTPFARPGVAASPRARFSTLPGYIFLAGLIGLALATKWFNIALPTECRSDPAPLVLGPDTEATLSVKSGTLCPLPVRSAADTIDAIDIVAAPENGTLVADRTGLVYRSQPNYRGSDTFTFMMRGRSVFHTGPTFVRVAVAVK
jgi:hypothetical protein